MPLIAAAWRRPLGALALAAAAAVALLAVLVFHGASTSFDTWVVKRLYAHIGPGMTDVLLGLTTPAISLVLLGIVVLVAARVRRWDVAALAVLGPGLTVLLTEVVLKPLIARYSTLIYFGVPLRGSFPSGHEATVAATACVLAIVAARLPARARTRILAVALLACWTAAAAVALTRALYHYATDTIGAILLAIAVVSLVAMLIDRLAVPVAGSVRRARQ
jgi:membrane-associated phospholipid phosphatase